MSTSKNILAMSEIKDQLWMQTVNILEGYYWKNVNLLLSRNLFEQIIPKTQMKLFSLFIKLATWLTDPLLSFVSDFAHPNYIPKTA